MKPIDAAVLEKALKDGLQYAFKIQNELNKMYIDKESGKMFRDTPIQACYALQAMSDLIKILQPHPVEPAPAKDSAPEAASGEVKDAAVLAKLEELIDFAQFGNSCYGKNIALIAVPDILNQVTALAKDAAELLEPGPAAAPAGKDMVK